MLSDEAKQELKHLARSARVREDFERIRKAGQRSSDRTGRLDRFVRFLTDMSHVFPHRRPAKSPEHYRNVRI